MSALPIEKDITIYQGAKWSINLRLTNSNGTPFDLTGYSAKMQIRHDENSEVLEELGVGTGITITPGSGDIKLDLTSTETAALKFKRAEFDVFIRSGTPGEDVCLIAGKVLVKKRKTIWNLA